MEAQGTTRTTVKEYLFQPLPGERHLLQWIANTLAALWVNAPTIVVFALLALCFWGSDEGRDLVRIAARSPVMRCITLVALAFLVFVAWYGARLVGYLHLRTLARAPRLRRYLPRFMGYAVITLLLVAIAELHCGLPGSWWLRCASLLASYGIYRLLLRACGHIAPKALLDTWERKATVRTELWMTATLTVLAGSVLLCLLRIPAWLWMVLLFLAQQAILVLIGCRHVWRELIMRRRTINTVLSRPTPTGYLQRRLDRYLREHPEEGLLDEGDATGAAMRTSPDLRKDSFYLGQFIWLGLVAIGVFVAANLGVRWALFIGPLPVVLIGLTVLLGVIEASRFFARLYGYNLAVPVLACSLLSGLVLLDPHVVRTVRTPQAIQRATLAGVMDPWLRMSPAPGDSTPIPMVFVLADGGGSRSGHWTALVLQRLMGATGGRLSNHMFCLSGASGGGLGLGAFHAGLVAPRLDGRYGNAPDAYTTLFGEDMLSHTLARMLGADVLNLIAPVFGRVDRAGALERSLEYHSIRGGSGMMTARFHAIAHAAHKPGNERPLPILAINTTRMQDAMPAAVSTIALDPSVFGRRVDVLAHLPERTTLRLSTALVLGARFPYVSPAGGIRTDRDTIMYFVDGGYVDNSGAGFVLDILMEIERRRRDAGDPLAPWLRRVRPIVIHIANSGEGPGLHRVHPVTNNALAPVLAITGAYGSQTRMGNARMRRFLERYFEGGRYFLFNLYEPGIGTPNDIPVSWALSQKARSDMERAADQLFREKGAQVDSIVALCRHP